MVKLNSTFLYISIACESHEHEKAMVGNPLIHLRKNNKGAVFLVKNSNKYPYLQNAGQKSYIDPRF